MSLSTIEAELIALCIVVSEGLWLRKLFLHLGIVLKNVQFYENNQECLALIKNLSNNCHVKNIDLKFNFVHNYYKMSFILLLYIRSEYQQGNIFTKELPNVLFEKFKRLQGIKDFSEEGMYQIAKTNISIFSIQTTFVISFAICIR